MPMTTTYSLSLDVSKYNRVQAIVAKQYDRESRFIRIQLKDNGKPITVPADVSVIINAARKADNTAKAFAGAVNDDGTVTVPITYWMLELVGSVDCDVAIVDTEGRRLSSLNFIIEVEHSNYNGDDISEDDENYDLLTSLLIKVAEANQAEAARVEAEEQRVIAEDARVTAEAERVEAETARVEAEKSRATSENLRATAESRRSIAETVRNSAEDDRVAAETQRQTDTAAAIEKIDAAVNAAWGAAEQMSLEDRDEGKQYTYKLFVENGYPGIELTEITE